MITLSWPYNVIGGVHKIMGNGEAATTKETKGCTIERHLFLARINGILLTENGCAMIREATEYRQGIFGKSMCAEM